MKHLHEIAILTQYTTNTAYNGQSTSSTAQVDSNTPRPHVAPQPIPYQSYASYYWNINAASWNAPPGQGDNVWMSTPSVNTNIPLPGEQWHVEDAKSVSNFTSQGSLSSPDRETDGWSRLSLVSHESISDPHYPQNDVPCEAGLPYRQQPDDQLDTDYGITFVPCSKPGDLWAKVNEGNSVFPPSRCDKETETVSDNHFETMLARVAQDLTSLEVDTSEGSVWSALGPSEMYGETFVPHQIFPGGSQNLHSGETHDEYYSSQQNLVSGAGNLHDDTCSTGQQARSAPDSGQVSRCSSLSSLMATSSSVSEDNLADTESYEDISQFREKRLTHKLNSRSSRITPVQFYNPFADTSQWSLQPQTSTLVTDQQEIRLGTAGYTSTSGYSDSMASYSMSSDSEMEIKHPGMSVEFTPWSDANLGTFYCPPPNLRNPFTNPSDSSTALKTRDSFYQTLETGFHPPSLWTRSQYANGHQSSYNELQKWDSGIENTANTTQYWDTVNDSSAGAVTGVFDKTHLGQSTQYWDTVSDSGACALTSFYDRAHFGHGNQHDIGQRWYSHAENITSNSAKLGLHHDSSPYLCQLDHDSDFQPLQDLVSQTLPGGYLYRKHLTTILDISHRVVKLRVRKAFQMLDQREDTHSGMGPTRAGHVDDEPALDHYGTGFVCHIDTEHAVVRTHAQLVATPLEASNTEVVFSLTFPDGGQSPEMTCTGLADGFWGHENSETSKFLCQTPSDLIPYLQMFKNVPVFRRTSLFYDSCYYSDSSADNSASVQEDMEKDPVGNVPQDIKSATRTGSDLDVDTQVRDELVTIRDNRTCPPQGDPASQSQGIHNQATVTSPDHAEYNYWTNMRTHRLTMLSQTANKQHDGELPNPPADLKHGVPINNTVLSSLNTELALADDTICINRTNAEVGTDDSSTDSVRSQWWHKYGKPVGSSMPICPRPAAPLASPLVIMERRYEAKNVTCGTRICPYADQALFGGNGTYTNFSSLAGDIFSNLIAASFPNKAMAASREHEDSTRWEYERLIFQQNHQRQAYNLLHKPQPLSDPGKSGSEPRTPTTSTDSIDITKVSTDSCVGIGDNQKLAESDTLAANVKSKDSVDCPGLKAASEDSSSGVSTESNGGSDIKPQNTFASPEPTGVASAGQPDSESVNIFAEFASTEGYLDTWSRDLLDLDTDLTPLPDVNFYEAMVNDLLENDQEDPCVEARLSPVCCPRAEFSQAPGVSSPGTPDGYGTFCLLISHPHGGPKMFSLGLFSRHHHLGGILYDTPTCMGSCGAPVIALQPGMESPYLTHFLHSGTLQVNNVPVGAGVSFVDQQLSIF